ncbi:MAG: O-methyltransferase [Actinomycetaceae bacterium]|nr:O-methyltransferase [Actinomycetaceae bacterium]
MDDNYLQAWSYAEQAHIEDPISQAVRHRGREYGIRPLSVTTCSLLTQLVSISKAQTVVEVGTGTGVSGLALLRGNPGLSLTTIDVETEAQAIAREAFNKAGFRPGLTRLINGRSADILPRLASGAYDFALIDSDPLEAEGDTEEVARILRPGGVLAIANALQGTAVADPTCRDESVVAMRQLVHNLMDNSRFTCSLLMVGDGLLLAQLNA